ncbi:MAG: hypothetical protein PVI54_17050, partial [Desulfobacteraceae bacterium]
MKKSLSNQNNAVTKKALQKKVLLLLFGLHFYASEGGKEYSPGCKPGGLNTPHPQAPKERQISFASV